MERSKEACAEERRGRERLSLEEKSTGEMAPGVDGECERKSRGDEMVLLSCSECVV